MNNVNSSMINELRYKAIRFETAKGNTMDDKARFIVGLINGGMSNGGIFTKETVQLLAKYNNELNLINSELLQLIQSKLRGNVSNYQNNFLNSAVRNYQPEESDEQAGGKKKKKKSASKKKSAAKKKSTKSKKGGAKKKKTTKKSKRTAKKKTTKKSKRTVKRGGAKRKVAKRTKKVAKRSVAKRSKKSVSRRSGRKH